LFGNIAYIIKESITLQQEELKRSKKKRERGAKAYY